MTVSDASDTDMAALDWLVLLQSGRASAADRAAFAAWRARDAANDRAAQEAEALWRDLGATPTAAGFAGHGATAAGPAGIARTGRGTGSQPRSLLWQAGASLAAVLALALLLASVFSPLDQLLADFSTGPGERRQVALPDGSLAFLNAATTIDIAYGAERRTVTLLAGSASFAVRPEPARPFVVHAATGEAEAIGTIFAVQRNGDGARVLVEEGVVEIRLPGHAARRVFAGEQARYESGGALETSAAGDIAAALAWRRGKLVFNRRPLAEVVAELEPHLGRRIVIADSDLRRLQVTGVFDLSAPGAILPAILGILRVDAVQLPYLTVLY